MRVKLIVLIGLLSALISRIEGKPVVTFVTSLYNIGREEHLGAASEAHFKNLLQTSSNLIVYGESSLKKYVSEHRAQKNTVFVEQSLEDIHRRWYSPLNEKVRSQKTDIKPKPNVVSQYTLKDYNPLQFSKVFMVEDAMTKHDIWSSDFFVWLDANALQVFD